MYATASAILMPQGLAIRTTQVSDVAAMAMAMASGLHPFLVRRSSNGPHALTITHPGLQMEAPELATELATEHRAWRVALRNHSSHPHPTNHNRVDYRQLRAAQRHLAHDGRAQLERRGGLGA